MKSGEINSFNPEPCAGICMNNIILFRSEEEFQAEDEGQIGEKRAVENRDVFIIDVGDFLNGF